MKDNSSSKSGGGGGAGAKGAVLQKEKGEKQMVGMCVRVRAKEC